MAEPAWYKYFDDQFQRANTSVGSGADNNTGVPGAPNVGPSDGWYDHEGNKFYINNNQLKRSGGSNSYQSTGLYRSAAEATVDQRIVVDYPAGQSPSAIYMRCSGASGASIWFNLSNTTAAYAVGKLSAWGSAGFVGAPVGYPTYANDKAYSVDVRVWGTGPTNWRVVIVNTTDSTTVYDQTGTIVGAKETAGVVALDGSGALNGVVSRVQAYTASFTLGALTPVSGSVTLTQTALSWTATLGGTAPVALALHRSTDPLATLGGGTLVADVTAVTPGTTYTHTPGGVAGTMQYYWLRATDSATPTPNVLTSPAVPLSTKIANIKIGLIGDSITEYMENGAAGMLASKFAELYPKYLLTTTNQGHASSDTGHWLPAGTYLPDAISAFQLAGVTHVLIMLGTNDARDAVARSASAYKTNMQAICNALVAAGFKVVLNTPPAYRLTYGPQSPGGYTESSYALLEQYVGKLDELANGTTIYRGDGQAFAVFAEQANTLIGDWVHPNVAGSAVLARLWFETLGSILGFTGSGSTSGSGVGLIYG